MKLSKYSRAIVFLAVCIYALNLPAYVAVDLRRAFPSPYHWGLGLALLSVPVLLNRHLDLNLAKAPIMAWGFIFMFVSFGGFYYSPQSELEWKEIILRGIAVFQMFWLFVLCAESGSVRVARWAFAVATLVNAMLNIYDFLFPEFFSDSRIAEGRAAGLHGNPNQAADALVIGMLFSTTLLPYVVRWPFMILVGIATILTFSRSGMVEWVVVAAGFMLTRSVGIKEIAAAVCVCLVVMVAIWIPFGDDLMSSWDKNVSHKRDLMERLNWMTSPGDVIDYSALERAYVARQSWEKIAEHPWMGHGTGSSARAYVGTHNVYLSYMEDYGVLGALVLPLLALAATWGAVGEVRLLAVLFACAMIWQGFFSHSIINNEVRTMMVSLMAAMVWISREHYMAERIEGRALWSKPSRHAET